MVRTRRRSAPSSSSSHGPVLPRLPSVGDVVEVSWDDRDESFCGVLGARLGPSKRSEPEFRFRVDYEDGDVVEHDLDAMRWRFLQPPSAWIQPGDLTDAVSRETPDPSFYGYNYSKHKRARTSAVTTTTTMSTGTDHANSENGISKQQITSFASPCPELGSTGRGRPCPSISTTPARVPVAAYSANRVKDAKHHEQFERIGEEVRAASHHSVVDHNGEEEDDSDDAKVDDVVRLVNLDAMSESCTPKEKLPPLDLSDLVSPRGVADFGKKSPAVRPSSAKSSPPPFASLSSAGNTTAHSHPEPWSDAWNCLRDSRVPLRKRLSFGHLRALADNR